MSRPTTPYRSPPPSNTTHQSSSPTRQSTESSHDLLPYLRPENSSSQPPPSSSTNAAAQPPLAPSAPSYERSAGSSASAGGLLPARASTLGSPGTEKQFDRPPPRPSRSASGHSSPITPVPVGAPPQNSIAAPSDETEFTPPQPAWLSSRSRSGSDENSGARSSPQGSSSLSGHSSSGGTNATSQNMSCYACGLPMTGQFVRALGTVYHLDCFRCKDCNDVVASKFFPIEVEGRQFPLCERDYFSRLNLICGKCDQALRGSYITACNKKYHVEHFTCSVCPTLFGPQDSYYEHSNDVFCHYHYSTRFAAKCVGCSSAILKQFVEINRNSRDECWHPECYMIHKFWNIKVVSRPTSIVADADALTEGQLYYDVEEASETHDSLREKQQKMEQKVYRIWTHLSAFEESSAACISEMLKHVSNSNYLEAIRMAEKFILHVEVLFAAIDDLEAHFSQVKNKGMSHVREARMLCRKTVDLFTLLSHTGEGGTTERMGMTQDLLSLVTGLAHYLKILIRIALTGALKLDREFGRNNALLEFLDKLQLLASGGGNPSARRVVPSARPQTIESGSAPLQPSGTQGVSYGYKSLAPENAGESPFIGRTNGPNGTNGAMSTPPSDLCVVCAKTVEEDCVRLGTYNRWHSHCVACATCSRTAVNEMPGTSTSRRPPPKALDFLFLPVAGADLDDIERHPPLPKSICCIDHPFPGSQQGFAAVSRLEQFAFLLNVALRRLYLLLLRRNIMPLASSVPSTATLAQDDSNSVAGNTDNIMRMKTVHLDRKLSATARIPKRSMIVESPSGRIAQPTDVQHSQARHGSVHQPQLQQPQPISTGPRKLSKPPPPGITIDSPYSPGPPTSASTIIRPDFARNNTQVAIIDDVRFDRDNEGGSEEDYNGSRTPKGRGGTFNEEDEGLTLGDIPQLLESEQAREQHRSLPRQGGKPLLAELTPIELLIVKHFAVLALHRSSLKDQFDLDEILELVEAKKSGFWNKIFKGDKKNIKKKGVFGVPIELLVERDGADSLLGASRATLRIPSFIDDVISAMKQMDMSVEGIFRKNGNIRRLKELSDAIDRDPASVDLSTDNPVQLAALLKKFLREMPDPLLTFKLHRLFITSQSFPTDAERHRYLHLVSILLPKAYRDTLEALFVFLKWVASFSHVDEETGSKMDLLNLATVICPNILYAKGRDAARDEAFMAIRVVTLLLEYQDDYFTVPDEFLPVLHDQEYFANAVDLPSKDVLKKCETYLRVKQGRGSSGNGSSHVNGNSAPLDRQASQQSVHPQRSDPMMRGRPAPPFADNQSNGKRSPRSQSRPPPSSVHSHHGYGSSASAQDHTAGWAPGSPPQNYRPPQIPPRSNQRMPSQHSDTDQSNWPPSNSLRETNMPRSRPASPYGAPRSSTDHSAW